MTDLTFTPEQERAINKMVEWYGDPEQQEFYLAGYAGVGKSTVCKEAIDRIKQRYGIHNVVTGAYTGKAAHVLRKKGNINAATIHNLIYVPVSHLEEKPPHMTDEEFARLKKNEELKFVLNPLGPASLAKLIVLDECSMIDKQMADDLRSFGVKILVMGDPGQLPPVNGEGSFTTRTPDVFLTQIHRQSADSPIIELATWARQGIDLPIGYHKGNVRVQALTNATAEAMHNPDTQVICGVHRVRWAVTQMMRKELGFTDQIPMSTERILCCKNNKEKGLFNGGMGTLSNLSINVDKSYRLTGSIEGTFYKDLLVDAALFRQHFDNGASEYDKKKSRLQFDWAYALTCHKAQGSSWNHITIIDDSDSFRDKKWLWLYTALTRAEEGLTILIKEKQDAKTNYASY